jgi:hypothetical protein
VLVVACNSKKVFPTLTAFVLFPPPHSGLNNVFVIFATTSFSSLAGFDIWQKKDNTSLEKKNHKQKKTPKNKLIEYRTERKI